MDSAAGMILVFCLMLIFLAYLFRKQNVKSQRSTTKTNNFTNIPSTSISQLELSKSLTLHGNKGMGPLLLKKIIEEDNEPQTVSYFAQYSVTCYELDKIIQTKRRGGKLDNYMQASPCNSSELPNLLVLYTAWSTAYEVLTPDLIKSFGGKEFIFNYRMYAARVTKGPTTCLVPLDDHYRPRFESLAKGGIALRGDALPAGALLEILSMKDLRMLAAELGIKEKFSKRVDILALLRETPRAESKVQERTNLEDVFYLPEPTVPAAQIEQAWHAVTHYVRVVKWAYFSENPSAFIEDS